MEHETTLINGTTSRLLPGYALAVTSHDPSIAFMFHSKMKKPRCVIAMETIEIDGAGRFSCPGVRQNVIARMKT